MSSDCSKFSLWKPCPFELAQAIWFKTSVPARVVRQLAAMRRLALVLAVAFATVGGDEVQNLRGETKSATNEESPAEVGAVVEEPKEPKGTKDQPKTPGVVEKEGSKGAAVPKAGQLGSPKTQPEKVGEVFEEDEEGEEDTSNEKSAHRRRRRRRPGGPGRRRRRPGGPGRRRRRRPGWR